MFTPAGTETHPMATRAGVEAALLAQRGYTGPEGVIEGKEGMEHCLGEGWDYTWLTDKLDSRSAVRTSKPLIVNPLVQQRTSVWTG